MEFLNVVLTLVAGLVGFPAVLAALINLLKFFDWLPDGSAGTASMVGHLIAYVGVAFLVLTGRVDLLPGIDLQLAAVAELILAVLAFLSSLGVSRGFHRRVLIGLPVVGHSYGLQLYKDMMDEMESFQPEPEGAEES